MERLSFDIFKSEKKKFRLTPNWIVLSLWAITILFLWIFDSVFPPNSAGRVIWLACVLAVTIYYLISSFFAYEPLKGILNGKIIFENGSITLYKEVFELKDISGLDFEFKDFCGKRILQMGANCNPTLSQGVGNYITFIDKNSQTQLIYFKLETKQSYLLLSPFINEAIKLKKMEFKRGIDLLGIENVVV
jgi:hypothetical protein